MPSLMAARWVGKNYSPIFRHLWTKVHLIKSACTGASVVCNTIFQLTTDYILLHSRDIYQVTKLCEIAHKRYVFGLPNFGGREGRSTFVGNPDL